MDLQAWQSHEVTLRLGPGRLVAINPLLTQWIPLDDAVGANQVLTGLADMEFDRTRDDLLALLGDVDDADSSLVSVPVVTEILARGVTAANLSVFTPSREYYRVFREGRESITQYVDLAERELLMVSVNLMTGHTFEQILLKFHEMIVTRSTPVSVTLSLLDPDLDYLMKGIAPTIGLDVDELSGQIHRVIEKASDFHDHLPRRQKGRFEVHAHAAIPPASAIIIDGEEEYGRIQLETKGYGLPPLKAFGFEVLSGSDFYKNLYESYTNLVSDGRRLVPE